MSEATRNQLALGVEANWNERAEDALWDAFGMDLFTDRMTNGISADGSGPFMGTGYTVNACYMCSGSAYSATTSDCCR